MLNYSYFYFFLAFQCTLCIQHHTPLYYIDPEVMRIFSPRITSCLNVTGMQNLHQELSQLSELSATEFFRSHELIAHIYFTDENNPYREMVYEKAEFEYIPLLPLSWRSQISIFSKESFPQCTYTRLIQDILSCYTYLQERDKKKPKDTILPRFSVASTYNMRTAMGSGMPTQIRRGTAWTSVSNFVMDLSIGHYERWPQCPDLVSNSKHSSLHRS